MWRRRQRRKSDKRQDEDGCVCRRVPEMVLGVCPLLAMPSVGVFFANNSKLILPVTKPIHNFAGRIKISMLCSNNLKLKLPYGHIICRCKIIVISSGFWRESIGRCPGTPVSASNGRNTPALTFYSVLETLLHPTSFPERLDKCCLFTASRVNEPLFQLLRTAWRL